MTQLIPNSNSEDCAPVAEVNRCHGPGKGHPCQHGRAAHEWQGDVGRHDGARCVNCGRRTTYKRLDHMNRIAAQRRLGQRIRAHLPERHTKYFTMDADTKILPIEALKPIRHRPDNRAEEFMRAAFEGRGPRREPLDVTRDGETYTIQDGNSTYHAAKKHGWKTLPVRIRR